MTTLFNSRKRSRPGLSIPAGLAGLALLGGCNLMPDFELQTGDIPTQWRHADQHRKEAVIDPHWWQTFGSAELDRLMAAALANNNDLAAAAQRVEQARAQAKIAGADLWPALGAAGAISGDQDSLGETDKKSASLAVAYEVDLWGANRGRRDAGKARLFGESFARDALKLVVMANVGQSYFELLATVERKRIAADFLQNVNEVLNIVEARFRAGAVSALDVAQQKTELAGARASLDLLDQQQALLENSLAILLGRPPADFRLAGERFADIAVPAIPAQQPFTLLRRRPDLRQAEMQLQAANLDVGIALSAFYPSLRINLDSLLANPQPAGLALAMAANLAQPLFQGGRLEGDLENAKARRAELLEIYQQSLLTAFKEVEDAAAVRLHAGRRSAALGEAVARAREAYRISLERYRVGAIDYQTMLTTQRSLLNAETGEVLARLDLLQALVGLYKALGGGWRG